MYQPPEETFNHDNMLKVGVASPEGTSVLANTKSFNTYGPEFCTGEYISNLRELTRRHGYLDMGFLAPNWLLDNANFYRQPNLDQRSIPCVYISNLYRFWRGSRSYKFLMTQEAHFKGTPGTGIEAQRFRLECADIFPSTETPFNIDDTSIVTTNVWGAATSAGSFAHRVYTDINPVLEVLVPFYSTAPCHILGSQVLSQDGNRMLMYARYRPFDANVNWTLPAIAFSTAMGDDGSFGFLVGTPHVNWNEPPP